MRLREAATSSGTPPQGSRAVPIRRGRDSARAAQGTLTFTGRARGDRLLKHGQGDVPALLLLCKADVVHPAVTELQVPQQQGCVLGEELNTARM